MPTITGKLVHNKDVLADPVSVWIQIDPGTGRLYSWSGSLELPEDHHFSFVTHSTCELVLADGRTGQIIPQTGDGLTIHFKGSGSLE